MASGSFPDFSKLSGTYTSILGYYFCKATGSFFLTRFSLWICDYICFVGQGSRREEEGGCHTCKETEEEKKKEEEEEEGEGRKKPLEYQGLSFVPSPTAR